MKILAVFLGKHFLASIFNRIPLDYDSFYFFLNSSTSDKLVKRKLGFFVIPVSVFRLLPFLLRDSTNAREKIGTTRGLDFFVLSVQLSQKLEGKSLIKNGLPNDIDLQSGR